MVQMLEVPIKAVKPTGETIEVPLDQIEVSLDDLQVAPMNTALVNGQPVPVDATWSGQLGLHAPDVSPVLGFLKGATGAVVDAAEGAKAGLASTVFHGGDLIRRATGMERVIDTPEAQAAMTAPDTFAGHAGKFVEQGAEFAMPLSKVSKGAAALSWLPRMAVEGAASAGMAGVQSGGDPASMTVGAFLPAVGSLALKGGSAAFQAAQRAAAGAEEGGIGGAIASAMRTAVPPAPKAMVFQALKPRNSRINFEPALERAIPEIKAVEGQLGKPVESVEDLLTATKIAKKGIRGQIETMLGPKRAQGFTADTSSVADAIENSIPRKVQMQDPAKAESINNLAQFYRKRLDIDDVDTLIRETNAELESYYNKNPGARARATASNPDTAQLEAEVSALREVRNKALDEPGAGAAAKELYRRYGSLMEVEDAAWRRANVAKRLQPESLTEQMSKITAARDIARAGARLVSGDVLGAGKSLVDLAGARAGMQTATFLKEQQTSDALIRRAFKLFKDAPAAIEMPPAVPIRGALPPAVTRLGGAEQADRSFVRGVPADYVRRDVRGLLPPAPTPLPAAPDPSFVRGVPAQYAQRERLQLPPRSSGPVIPSGEPVPMGPERPDASSVGARRAAPVDFRYEQTRGTGGRASQRLVPTQYSSDPRAIAARKMAAPKATGDTVDALKWIQQDMEHIPYHGKNFNEVATRHGGDLEVSGGSAGAPIYSAIVGDNGPGRAAVIKAVQELIEGTGQRSPLKEAIIDVAQQLVEGKGAKLRMMTPPPGVLGKRAQQAVEDRAFSAFADDLGDLGPVSGGGREPGEEGKATIRSLLGLGGGSVAAAELFRRLHAKPSK